MLKFICSYSILGRPRGPPIRSSMTNLRSRPKTISSNVNVQKGGIRQTSYTGQIIPRPKNDGLSVSTPRTRDSNRNEIANNGGNLSNKNIPNNRGRGSSTLSQKPQKQPLQNFENENLNSNQAFLSRYGHHTFKTLLVMRTYFYLLHFFGIDIELCRFIHILKTQCIWCVIFDLEASTQTY